MSRERFLRLTLRIAAATALVSLVAPAAGAQSDGAFVPVTDAMLEEPEAGDWLHWRRTQNGWAYSPLDQIDRENVGDLTMAWSRGLQPGSQQGTPLVYDGVMYYPNPSSVTQAIDAATGDLLWEYKRPIPKDIATYVGGLETVNRSLAIYGGLIIDTANDGYVYALDAVTGELVWETEIVDYETEPARHSTGPIVAAGRVISGRSCRPNRGPEACFIAAHSAVTGEELWRRPLIPGPGEPGNETWGDLPFEDRHHVGSWMAPSYDPELELLILGTSVTSPAPKFLLGGHEKRHLFHNSTLALEVDTGNVRWYYQHLNDHWDLDHPFERLLVDTVVAPDAEAVAWRNPRIEAGEMRKVVTGVPGKTGLVYTLDRETGEFLWARPTVPQNVIERIDGATGAVVENPEVVFTELEQERLICPSLLGGKDWEAGAYSPLTNTMYYPLRNLCSQMTTRVGRGAMHYALVNETQPAPGKELLGTVYAISAETGETRWLHERFAVTMSLVATGGGLVFGGDVGGRFWALDQETGEVLWEINLGSSVTGFPVSYAVDGRQYVAVGTGAEGGSTSTFRRLTSELRPSSNNTLFVFALP